MPKKVYIAAGIGNEEQAKRLCELLQSYGHKVTYQWWNQNPKDTVRDKAILDLEGVREADLTVALIRPLESSKQQGTHFELGYATALGKTVLIHIDKTELEDLYNTDKYLVFYSLPNVRFSHKKTLDELAEQIYKYM